MRLSRTFVIGLAVLSFIPSARADNRSLPATCSYEMQVWNVREKRSVDAKRVEHLYSDLKPEEIDSATGCTVCSEDQVSIEIRGLPAFAVCHKTALRVHDVLTQLMRNGAPVRTVEGYRVIKSRGPVDVNGNRTGFSNHSFGTAIDINSEQNGLYDNCIEFGPQCRLLRGGEWRPGAPGTLDRSSDIVILFKRAGFKWGGEIAGKQKDFMHFSVTGY